MSEETSRGDADTQAARKGKPSLAFTSEQMKKQAEIKHKNKMDALASELIINRDDQYTKLSAIWADANDEERKSIIFGLVMNNGASARDITRLFAIKSDAIKPYASVMDQAIAALKLKIQGNQIVIAFMSDQPHLKFFLGKQFAEQVENPAHEGKQSIDESKEHQVTINVVGKDAADSAVNATGTDSVLSQTHLIQ